MLIMCDNKSCHQQSEAKLDVDTMEVICAKCGKPISNVTETMKRVLKSSGQVVRSGSRKAFTMACMSCHANRQVVLNEKDEAVCKVCHSKINVHPAMKQALMELGERLDVQTSEKAETEAEEKPKKKVRRRKKAK